MRRLRPATSVAAVMALATLFLASLPTLSAADSGSRPEAYYTVTITNMTDGQYLTPPNWAAHDRDADVYQVGQPASPELAALAENGAWPEFADYLQGAVDDAGHGVSGVALDDGAIGPGLSTTFGFSTSANRFSLAAMVICTNDGFAGLDAKALPTRDGQTRTYRARAFDAGSERNTEMRADLVPAPFCGDGGGTGMSNPDLAENGVIRPHRTLRGVGDLNPALDWRGPVAKVEITRHDPAPTYRVTIHNSTDGQYLTPPNFAFHDRSVDLFQNGRAAGPALMGLAENGAVMEMAAAIEEEVDDNGLGTSGVAPGMALKPGDETSFTVTTDANRLTILSMVICTNDGFAGLDSKTLPRWEGDSRTYRVRAFDAGTERNTEMRADLVPAPFCGDGDGTGMSNPDLAENGVVRPHRTLRGVGDLNPSLDWRGPVMTVTVERVPAGAATSS